MTRLKADLLLLTCAFIWGTAFVAQKDLHARDWPALFVASRFVLSALLLAPLAWREARRAPEAIGRRGLGLALAVGLCVGTAASMQQWALTTTSATNGGFLTAVYVAFVPFVVWGLSGARPRSLVLLAVAVSVLGAWLLAGGGTHGWSRGDLVLLASDLVWALHISLVGLFLGRVNRPYLLCFVQYGVTAVLAGALSLATERAQWSDFQASLPAIAYAGIASGGIAYTLQIVAQRHAPAAEAALIMSLESVFAAVAGAIVLHERLTPVAMLGGLLILAGAVMLDVAPALRRAFPAEWRAVPAGPAGFDEDWRGISHRFRLPGLAQGNRSARAPSPARGGWPGTSRTGPRAAGSSPAAGAPGALASRPRAPCSRSAPTCPGLRAPARAPRTASCSARPPARARCGARRRG